MGLGGDGGVRVREYDWAGEWKVVGEISELAESWEVGRVKGRLGM